MPPALNATLLAVLAYALGSLSPAYFAGKARGLDLRFEGRETLDARNAGELLGLPAGALVFVGDVLKAQIAIGLALYLGNSPLAIVGASLGVVAGHLWPLYHGFAGGDALAPAAGVLLAVAPWTLLIAFTLLTLLACIAGRAAYSEIATAALLPGVALLAEKGRLDTLAIAVGLAIILIAARWGEVEILLGIRRREETSEDEKPGSG